MNANIECSSQMLPRGINKLKDLIKIMIYSILYEVGQYFRLANYHLINLTQ